MKTEKQGTEESLNIYSEWDDKHVFPPAINPDSAFLYSSGDISSCLTHVTVLQQPGNAFGIADLI